MDQKQPNPVLVDVSETPLVTKDFDELSLSKPFSLGSPAKPLQGQQPTPSAFSNERTEKSCVPHHTTTPQRKKSMLGRVRSNHAFSWIENILSETVDTSLSPQLQPTPAPEETPNNPTAAAPTHTQNDHVPLPDVHSEVAVKAEPSVGDFVVAKELPESTEENSGVESPTPPFLVQPRPQSSLLSGTSPSSQSSITTASDSGSLGPQPNPATAPYPPELSLSPPPMSRLLEEDMLAMFIPEPLSSQQRRALRKQHRHLKRYGDVLQEAIEQRALVVRNCSMSETSLRQRANRGTVELKRRMLTPLLSVFRKMQHLRLAMIHTQRELAMCSIVLLKVKRAEAAALSDDPLGLKGAVPLDFFAPVEDVFRNSRHYQEQVDMESILQEMYVQQERLYSSLSRSLSQNMEGAHRSRRLRSLLKNTTPIWRDSGVSFHPLDEHDQSTFSSLLRDQQHPEGRMLAQVVKVVNADATGEAKKQVVPFIGYLVDQMCESHKIPRQHVPSLRLYIARTLFPLVSDRSFRNAFESKRDEDARFQHNQKWLRQFTEREVGIPSGFSGTTRPSESPYLVASALLEDVSFHVVPLDILNVIREASRTMFEQAKRTANDPDARIDADSFFPIVIFACIHAELWDVHSILSYLAHFVSEHEKVVEVGYYLTCLEGAAQYITHATEDSIKAFNTPTPTATPPQTPPQQRQAADSVSFNCEIDRYSVDNEGDFFPQTPPTQSALPKNNSLFQGM